MIIILFKFFHQVFSLKNISNSYSAGHFDLLINKFNSFEVFGQENDERAKIMTTVGLNELLKLRLLDQERNFDDVLDIFVDRSPNSLPDGQFKFMLIGIFSSSGIKRIIETESVFRYERVPSQGHFSCAKYDFDNSKLIYFETPAPKFLPT